MANIDALIKRWAAEKVGMDVNDVHSVAFAIDDGYMISELTYDFDNAQLCVNGKTTSYSVSAAEAMRELLKLLEVEVW